MKLKDVLLTVDEMEKAIGGEFCDDPLLILDFQSACKAQCLKLLEWQKKEGHIFCLYIWWTPPFIVPEGSTTGGANSAQYIHDPDCWLCALEKLLKE